MAAQVISFAERLRAPAFRDWSRQELAEFYRVESALLQAGLELETERGLSDEGDPWFVFCRADTGEVFIHFARCDGWYVVDGAAMGSPSRGRDFGALVRDLIARHPLSDARRPGSNVLMHPAALLIALVGAAFFHSGRAKAAEVAHADGADPAHEVRESRRGLTLNVGSAAPAAADGSRVVALDASEVAAVLTGVAIGLRELADAPAAAAGVPAEPLAVPASAPLTSPLRDLADRSSRGASADVLGALTASEARAALTVMAVVHDLARSATVASAAAPATPAAVLAADLTPRADFAAPAGGAPPSGGEANPLIVVHLGSGPLPQIEALAIVAADGALARVSLDHVVQVDQLSNFLQDALNHGETVFVGGGSGGGSGSGGGGSGSDGGSGVDPVASNSADPSATTGDHTPGQNVAPDAAHPHDAVVKPAPADGHTSAAASSHAAGADASTPATPAATSPPASPPSVIPLSMQPDHAAAAPDHPAYIDTAVLAFVTAVSDVQVVIAGSEVVFYDPQIMGALAPGETLDSVTWRMSDGSSVSLVGTASEIHAFHGLG